jgi:hypothetical protein
LLLLYRVAVGGLILNVPPQAFSFKAVGEFSLCFSPHLLKAKKVSDAPTRYARFSQCLFFANGQYFFLWLGFSSMLLAPVC